MKKFLTVLEFELMSYIKNKSFMIATILLALLLTGSMFIDLSGDNQGDDSTLVQNRIMKKKKHLLCMTKPK